MIRFRVASYVFRVSVFRLIISVSKVGSATVPIPLQAGRAVARPTVMLSFSLTPET